MRRYTILWLAMAVLLASCTAGTRSGCPPTTGSPGYLDTPPEMLPSPTPRPFPTPTLVSIGGRLVPVDKVVEGPLCNDTWTGTVYVTCDVQVYPWEGQPTFLKGCDLTIQPGTVVYVAAHGDAVFYQGCSCHTGPAGP